MGVPLSSSGVPPFPAYPSAPSASAPTPAAAWPPSSAYADPHAFLYAPPHADPLSNSEERSPDADQPSFDLSAPPLSLDSFRSEYQRMMEYICGLFPQAAGAPPVTPPLRALFESFFAASTPSQQSLSFNWFDRVRTALVDADAHMASGRSNRYLPPRHISYVVHGEHASGKAVPINESLLAHFDKPLRPSLLVGLAVCDSMALEASFCAQSEALSYSMWVLSGLLGFVCPQGFTPADPALFNQLVMALSKSFAHQTQVSASHTAYICHKWLEFYLSHLPTYFSNVTKCSMLSSPAVFVDSLFREEDVTRFLDATRSSSSLRSQQAMVDVASRQSSTSSSRARRYSPSRSPYRSPARRRRQASGLPSRPQKKVQFDSQAPSSAMKSPCKSHFRD